MGTVHHDATSATSVIDRDARLQRGFPREPVNRQARISCHVVALAGTSRGEIYWETATATSPDAPIDETARASLETYT